MLYFPGVCTQRGVSCPSFRAAWVGTPEPARLPRAVSSVPPRSHSRPTGGAPQTLPSCGSIGQRVTGRPRGCHTGVRVRSMHETFLRFRSQERVPGGGRRPVPPREFVRLREELTISRSAAGIRGCFSGCNRERFTDYNRIWKDANFREINLFLQKLELWLWRLPWPRLCLAQALGLWAPALS